MIGTTSREVRQCALRHIVRLCGIKTSVCDIRSIIHQIILKAQLPLWVSSIGGTRSSNQKLLSQSIEYFHLRCHLTEHLTGPQQAILGINAKELLAEELNWLANYAISSTSTDLRTIDNVLFLGHLKFIRTLLTCEHVDKKQCGADLIRLLIDQFLFPASRRIALPMQTLAHETMTTDESVDESAPEPKCSTNESRLAAYDVLVELVRHCPANLQTVVDDLIHLHHRLRVEKQTEWEVRNQPPIVIMNRHALHILVHATSESSCILRTSRTLQWYDGFSVLTYARRGCALLSNEFHAFPMQPCQREKCSTVLDSFRWCHVLHELDPSTIVHAPSNIGVHSEYPGRW